MPEPLLDTLARAFSGMRRRGAVDGSMLPPRPTKASMTAMTTRTAMRNSAVWASCRLRADLVSSLPIDAYRRVGAVQIEVPKPPVLVNPGGERVDMGEWMYSTQMDLDTVGNTFGIITELDGGQRPKRIDLVPHQAVTVKVKKTTGEISYVIDGKTYAEREIWHERQYTVSGLVMGLSPVAYAAWSLGLWAAAVDFGMDWFSNHGMIPFAHLKNEQKTLDDTQSDKVKKRFKAAIEGGDVFVTGKDWSFSTTNTPAADARFLEAQGYSDTDVVRFFGVPGDLIDANVKGSSITYANIAQRNLQFLIMNLGPVIARRERALSRLLPAPRFVKLNTDALLRLDPKSVSEKLAAEMKAGLTTPTEARALLNREPLTDADYAEFAQLTAALTAKQPPTSKES